MSQAFIHEDFMLDTEVARRLYHDVAKRQPIIDYHCHLPPEQVANNHRFANLTEIWLSGDHYKWRAMRTNGVDERFCTGDASDWEKFLAWSKTVPRTLRNPLYHWTHLELAFPFGISDCLLDEKSARRVYDQCNEKLAQPEFRAQGLLRQFDVRVVCTTDDPTDSLEHHVAYAKVSGRHTALLPTWRPDRAIAVSDPSIYNRWLDELSRAADLSISTYDDLLAALGRRHDTFHEIGCRLSDHGLETMLADPLSAKGAARAFAKIRASQGLAVDEEQCLQATLLHELALMDHARGWVQQFHIGALRNNNTRLLRTLGPDTGFDSIGDWPVASALSRFLDRLDNTDQLAKTILYNLNPRDNELYATMIGNFQDGSVPGKLQYGSAWWFLDQKSGMERQLDALSNMSLLSRFVGMLTDSRSFLSYSRHDYFRRLLCNLLGSEVEAGLLPRDEGLLGDLVEGVCYVNAREYFPFEGS